MIILLGSENGQLTALHNLDESHKQVVWGPENNFETGKSVLEIKMAITSGEEAGSGAWETSFMGGWQHLFVGL